MKLKKHTNSQSAHEGVLRVHLCDVGDALGQVMHGNFVTCAKKSAKNE
jgi:hypothetical protein